MIAGGRMELRQLRYFVAVAEELHFGRAAQRLDIVQPAVSQQVGRLERELGVRLLDRSPRHVALTGDGARLLVEAKAVLAAADRVTAVAADLAAGRAATIRLGTSPGLTDRVLRGIATLRASTPDLGLVLVDGTAAEHCAALRAGTLDIALVRGDIGVDGLRAVPLHRDELVAVLPATHPLADRPAVAVADLAGLTLRLPERHVDIALYDAVLGACRTAGFAPSLGRPVTSIEDAVVEIGSGSGEWTVVHGSVPGPVAAAAAQRPLTPPLSVRVQLLVRADLPDCIDALVATFG